MASMPSAKPKVLSTTEMTRRAQKFVATWKGASSEQADAQTWWNDLFETFGLDRRTVAVFEHRAKRASTGERGRIDIFMPGVMIGESKSLGKDLEAAESQALDYLATGDIAAAEMPRYVVASDFDVIRIRDLESPSDDPIQFRVQDLTKNIRHFAFLSGYRAPKRAVEKQEAVTVQAARTMGALYDTLLGDVDAMSEGHDSEQAAVFMTRLLFLLYGDDAGGLWEQGLFERFILQYTGEDGSDSGALITQLFQVLDTPKQRRSPHLDDIYLAFPYVNGGLFRDRVDIPTFNRGMRAALLAACREEWSEVSPAIFGSLFQGMSSREARRKQGEHYTTETNILKTLRPLFLDGIEEKLKAAWPSESALLKLHDSFEGMRYMDPAMGCGNFVIVAYREMRDIELRLLQRLRELRGETTAYTLDGTWDLKVSPEQFGGIEINWWPAKIAETAMFLVDHQANQRMAESLGAAPERLPIKLAPRIVHGNALRVPWSDVFPPTDSTYVFGNPPFLGHKTRDADQLADFRAAWGDVDISRLDFVTGWHAIALRYLSATKSAQFAFVTTNSITQGDQVRLLFAPILAAGWHISFAHRTFAWTTEATGGAAVHCVIVGFTKDALGGRRLFEYLNPKAEPVEISGVPNINPYLVAAPDALIDKHSKVLSPSLSPATYGSMPRDGGHLLVEPGDYAAVAADPIASKYLRRFVGASELIKGDDRWCLWMEGADLSDLPKSPILRERLEAVRALRAASSAESTRGYADRPYLFVQRAQPRAAYICIPAHFTESRAFATVAFFEPDVIASNANFTAVDPDGLLFGVISSSMYMAWQRTVGGRIKSDLRFGNTITWNSFPFPQLTESERQRIIDAGKAILAARAEQPGKSLADLYQPLAMAASLLAAHKALDRVVDRVFGFAKPPTDVARLERLFERYTALTSTAQVVTL
ncbi:class I SAM-dependent DNA methyltransferase [Curtobacterium sp. MCLR17_036]|uniref:DNA methyltransferase n=1 Tax=Curtobacterium sp. MCLR17_036 TaxID=2175620 RepID=UPI000DAACBD5|nr:DNA methyltransferase [Curtobacterium sp. MCLR17_036]WIE66203.1 class I SAM-dependent DNA methyltransferase [Curtobacterium sp. MCLR17_036]